MDPPDDVVAIKGEQEEDEARHSPHQPIDILRTRLMLTGRELRVQIRYRDLPDSSGEDSFDSAFRAEVYVKPRAGAVVDFMLDWYKGGNPRTEAVRIRPEALLNCDWAGTVDRGRDLVDIRVPSRCLKNPDSVRVSLNSVAWMQLGELVAWDDAFENGRHPPRRVYALSWSPQIDAAG